MGGIVLTKITDSDSGVAYLVNLNFLSYVEWDNGTSFFRLHFLDNTLTIFLDRDSFEAFRDEAQLPNLTLP